MQEKEYIFEVPRKILLNANVSYHRFDKGNRAKKLRNLGWEQTKDNSEHFNYFTVKVLVCPPTRRRIDPPNLYLTVKHLIDGMTDAGLWEDDDWTHLKDMTFSYGGLSGIKDVFLFKLIVREVSDE